MLTRAVCGWAGVPLVDSELPRRSAQLTALFDAAASGAGRHVRARLARLEAEAWLAGLVREARTRHDVFTARSAAERVAAHRDEHGALLAPRIAAVEPLNLLRPTVAVSVYIVFVAHALHAHPAWRAILGEPATAAEALRFRPGSAAPLPVLSGHRGPGPARLRVERDALPGRPPRPARPV